MNDMLTTFKVFSGYEVWSKYSLMCVVSDSEQKYWSEQSPNFFYYYNFLNWYRALINYKKWSVFS